MRLDVGEDMLRRNDNDNIPPRPCIMTDQGKRKPLGTVTLELVYPVELVERK